MYQYDWSSDLCFFFFKQKTAYEIYQCDWSSDVCSSDLITNEDLSRDLDITPARNQGASPDSGAYETGGM